MNESYVNRLRDEIKQQHNEAIEKMLGDGISKGIIEIRQSVPILIHDGPSDKMLFRQSLVIDYKGAERIEELERENAFLKELNGNLHKGLSEFFDKYKPNSFLEHQENL